MRVAGGVQWGSALIAGGPIPAAPTIESVSPDIGDTATANPGVVITGTFPGSLVSVRFALGVTSYQATVTAHSPTSITVTTPALSIGAWDVVVTTRGGVAIAVEAYTAWDPVAAGSSLGWWRGDSGLTLDGDGKAISWASKDAVPVVCTFVVRPTPFADASLGGRTALNFAGGCYGTASVNTTNQVVIKAVGYTANSTAYCVDAVTDKRILWSNAAGKWTSFDGISVASTRNASLPTVFMQRFTGDATAKQYTHAITPTTVNIGSSAASSAFLIAGGVVKWNGTIAEVLVTTAAIANDPLSMRHSAANFGLTLGA